MNENTNATVTKRRGRPKKVETTPTTPVTETQKISDIVSRNVKAATKEKGSPLTREELTQACLTPKDMIDEHGVFMGEDYAKILKKPHSAEELDIIAKKYQYDPVKDRMLIRIYFFDELLAVTPGDPQITSSYLNGLSCDAMSRDEEIMVAGAQAVADKMRERFEVIDGKLVWHARRWMSYIRDRANCIQSVGDSQTSEASNLKNNVLNRISFSRTYFPLTLPKGGKIRYDDRGMPGDGYKRETSLKSSEAAPIGTTTYFVVQIENRVVCGKEKDKRVSTRDVIREALNNGVTKGTGGWRGSGLTGKFLWEELNPEGVVIDGNTLHYLGCTSNESGFKDAFYAYARNRQMADAEHAELEEFQL